MAARVEMPDGSVVAVDPAEAFVRPSSAAQAAPEFVSSSSATIVFPQLVVGARITSRWRFAERGRSIFGLERLHLGAIDAEGAVAPEGGGAGNPSPGR